MATLQVELAGSGYNFPAVPPLTLHAPTLARVDVSEPVYVEGEEVPVPSDAPFVFRWQYPEGERVTRLLLWMFLSGQGHDGDIYCIWPAERGEGAVPAALLTDLRQRIGGGNPISGDINLFTGDGAEVAQRNASYVFLVPASFTSYDNQAFRLE